MHGLGLTLTYVGGPTAVLELGGLRLLTDPRTTAAGAGHRGRSSGSVAASSSSAQLPTAFPTPS